MNEVPSRLHPGSIKTLEELVKLHGAKGLIMAIREIEARLAKLNKKSDR